MKTKIALIALTTYLLFSPCEAMMRRLITSVPKIMQALPKSPCMLFHQNSIGHDLPGFNMIDFDDDEFTELLGEENLVQFEFLFQVPRGTLFALCKYIFYKKLPDESPSLILKDALEKMLANEYDTKLHEELLLMKKLGLPDSIVPEDSSKEEMMRITKKMHESIHGIETRKYEWIMEEIEKIHEKIDILLQEKDTD